MSFYSQQERNEEFIWYDGGNSPITSPAEFPDRNDVTKETETDWLQRTPGSHTSSSSLLKDLMVVVRDINMKFDVKTFT